MAGTDDNNMDDTQNNYGHAKLPEGAYKACGNNCYVDNYYADMIAHKIPGFHETCLLLPG